jgi:hypothetical protein
MAEVVIEGNCDPRFARVRAAFAENFAQRNEYGAAVAVYVDGVPVLDLWGGHADRDRTRPWTRDTIVNLFSTTKGLTAICAHRLADQGMLDFDAPVARYWPEFAQAGKATIPVRQLLNHQAGLPALRRQLPAGAMFDWTAMTAALAAEEPWWTPGTRHGYHAITYGWLVGEVVRVEPRPIRALQEAGYIPVVAPTAGDEAGATYNINADLVAGEVAAALVAEKLMLLTDTDGILDKEGRLLSTLPRPAVERLIADGTISRGMLPKVQACLTALKAGVRKTHIINGTRQHALIEELLTPEGIGTEIVA